MAVRIPFYNQQTTPSGGAPMPRARGQEFVAPDLTPIASGLNSIAAVTMAEERKLANERRVLDEQAAETRAIVAQSNALNDLNATVSGIKNGILDGSIDKEKAFDLWKEEAPKTVTARLEGLDPNRRERTNAQLLLPIGKMSREVLDAIDSKNRDDVVSGMASYLEGMERYALTDPNYAIVAGVNTIAQMGPAAGLTPDQIQKQQQAFKERVSMSVANDYIVKNQANPEALKSAQKAILEDVNLTPQNQTALYNRVETYLARADKRAEQEQKLAEKEQDQKNAVLASDLEINVKRGQAGFAEIEQALLDGVITPAKRTELVLHIDRESEKITEEAQKTQAQINTVSDALGKRSFLDFRTDADRDAVDAYFASVLAPSLQNLDPGEQVQAVVTFAGDTGIIPTQVKKQIRGSLRAGAPVDKVQAADFLDRLKGVNPQVINDFTENDIALGNAIASYVAGGAPAPKAVEMAENALAIPEAERKVRESRYRIDKAQEKNLKRLQNELATGRNLFSPDMPADVPDALVGDYEGFVRTEFLRTGDLEVAQKTGLDFLKNVWGVTNIGGKRWMKYAPEVVYQVPGEDGTWIAEQLDMELRTDALVPEGAKFSIQADVMTPRQKNPSYQVLMIKDGAIQPVLGKDNLPVRFQPNYATSAAAKKRRDGSYYREYEAASNLYQEALKNNAPRETLDKLKAKADAAYERTRVNN